MVVVLSVAEKPSVAKELAAIISKRKPESIRRNGYSHYNPIFEIESCPFRNTNVSMVITSVAGHLMELEFDSNYKSWNSCSPLDLFQAPVKKSVKKEFLEIKKTLISESKKCDILLLWLDCDLEGENISFEVIEVCKEANPALEVYRARFSALIERDILRSLRSPDRPNRYMNDAVEARQEIDLRIGAAFTRFQTLRLQNKYPNFSKSVISYGPCQFPTLGFVVDRFLKRESFQKQIFWSISVNVDFSKQSFDFLKKSIISFNWSRHHVYDKFTAIILLENCLVCNEYGEITNFIENETCKKKPFPLNTVEFQILSSRFLKISSERAMNIAETLYQKGILSYPRTETNFFQSDYDLKNIIGEFSNHSIYGGYSKILIDSNGFEWPRDGKKDDKAHPPIHPTKMVELLNLENEDERNVYDLVVRYFLACCSKDALGFKTTITMELPKRGESFTAEGLVVRERNYLEIISKFDHWSSHEIPKVKIGDKLKIDSIQLIEGKTSPPDLLSESELISLMDRNQIGTDATIATHISTIQSREYVSKDSQNKFIPSSLGLALVEGYNEMGYQLNRPELRAMIEHDCQRIAKNEISKLEVIKKCLNIMKECFITCNREAYKLDQAIEKYFTKIGFEDNSQYILINPNFTNCALCNQSMKLLVTSNSQSQDIKRFLLCDYCKKSYILPSKGELIHTNNYCKICSFEVIIIKNNETKKEYHICTNCFSNPPPPPYGIYGINQFSCFSCSNDLCSFSQRLSGGEINISSCLSLNCPGNMKLKKSLNGYYIACSNLACKSAAWFPKCVKNAYSLENFICEKCATKGKVHKLKILLIASKIPIGMEHEVIVCPSCDEFWKEINCNPPLFMLPSRNNALQESISNSKIPEESPLCYCGLNAKPQLVRKEGSTKGKEFYNCCNSNSTRLDKCTFFQWKEDSLNSSSSKRQNTLGICSRCKQFGHSARDCNLL